MKKKVNKILYSSEELINCYNNIFRNALKKPNISAIRHIARDCEFKVLDTVRKYDYSIYNNDATRLYELTEPYSAEYCPFIDDVETEAALSRASRYIATPYSIMQLRPDMGSPRNDFFIMFCDIGDYIRDYIRDSIRGK